MCDPTRRSAYALDHVRCLPLPAPCSEEERKPTTEFKDAWTLFNNACHNSWQLGDDCEESNMSSTT